MACSSFSHSPGAEIADIEVLIAVTTEVFDKLVGLGLCLTKIYVTTKCCVGETRTLPSRAIGGGVGSAAPAGLLLTPCRLGYRMSGKTGEVQEEKARLTAEVKNRDPAVQAAEVLYHKAQAPEA